MSAVAERFDVWTAKVTVYDRQAAALKILYFCTGLGLTTQSGHTPANTTYIPKLIQPALVRQDAFDDATTTGASRSGVGNLILDNEDGKLDAFAHYAVAGHPVEIRKGDIHADPATHSVRFRGTMLYPIRGTKTIEIKLRDTQVDVDVAFQDTKFAGDNSLPDGLEGVEDLKGKPKPVVLGRVKRYSPRLVNSTRRIYQIADALIEDVLDVRDGGLLLSPAMTPGNIATWSVTSAIANAPFRSMAFGHGEFMALTRLDGTNGVQIWASRDLQNWEKRWTHPWPSATDGFGIAYSTGAKQWVAFVGLDVVTSDNGRDWVLHYQSTSQGLWDATWANGYWWAPTYAGKVHKSPDGVLWISTNTLTSTDLQQSNIAYSPTLDRMVAHHSLGSVQTYDFVGGTWTQRTTGLSNQVVWRFIWDEVNAQFVGIGGAFGTYTNKAYTSPDGVTWTAHTITASNIVLLDIRARGNTLIAAGMTNGGVATIYTSTDGGSTWTSQTTTMTVDATWLAVGNGLVGACGYKISPSEGYVTFCSGGELNYADATELEDDDLEPDPGCYRVLMDAAGSYIRLGDSAQSVLTMDVVEGAAAADRTAAQLFVRALQRRGYTTGDWSASDVTALDAANSAEIGVPAVDETRVSEILNIIAGSVGASWGVDDDGVFWIRRLEAPSGSPAIEIVEDDLLEDLVERAPNDEDKGIPTFRTIVRYGRSYTVLAGSQLFADIDDALRADFGLEWREAKDEDAGVQTIWPLARQRVIDTALAFEADAQDEAEREQDLRGVERRVFDLVVQLTDARSAVKKFGVIQLKHSRYELSAGQLFRVIGIEKDAAAERLKFTVWG